MPMAVDVGVSPWKQQIAPGGRYHFSALHTKHEELNPKHVSATDEHLRRTHLVTT